MSEEGYSIQELLCSRASTLRRGLPAETPQRYALLVQTCAVVADSLRDSSASSACAFTLAGDSQLVVAQLGGLWR
eukprot:7410855-Karenia_brevis.AAC.1